jgi:hypothetical protein
MHPARGSPSNYSTETGCDVNGNDEMESCDKPHEAVQYDHREARKTMLARILADGVVLVHFFWIVFLIFGACAGRRNRTIKYIHIGGLVFAITLQIFDWYCPLTHLEVWLRSRHDPSRAYAGSYIVHYLEKIIYVEVDRWVITALTAVLCGMNVWIYGRRRRVNKAG